jgi:ketosteroid isomerase-like protein
VSQADIELVRRMMDAWRGSAPETALAYLHPNIEYDATVRPDGKVWHGRDGVREAMLEWTGTWSDWILEVERYLDVGDDRVAVLWSERGRAKGSGVPMTLRGISVLTIRDGLIVSLVATLDRERTLAELGLGQERDRGD